MINSVTSYYTIPSYVTSSRPAYSDEVDGLRMMDNGIMGNESITFGSMCYLDNNCR
jgi:hypothetical protein